MSLKAPKTSSQHRFHLQDGLRGVAAILIVWHHAAPFSGASLPNAFLAVDFFFCLSGFVIAHAYGQKLEERMSLRSFFILRLIRLFPLYALGTLLLFLRLPFNTERMAYIKIHPALGVFVMLCAIVGLPNVFSSAFGGALYPFNFPAWTLSYEMVSNVGYAASVRKRIATAVLTTVCIISLGILVVAASSHKTMELGALNAEWLPGLARVGFSFSVGVFLYRLYIRRAVSPRASNVLALLLTAVFVVTLTLHAQSSIFQLLSIVLVFPAIVYFSAGISLSGGLLMASIFCGDLSYPLYTLHTGLLPPHASPRLTSFATQHPALAPLFFFIFLVVLCVVTWLIGTKWDVPLRRRLVSRINQSKAKPVSV